MDTIPETQDTTRTGWERTVTPAPAIGPHPYLAGAIDGFNGTTPHVCWLGFPQYWVGYEDGRSARSEAAARPGGPAA